MMLKNFFAALLLSFGIAWCDPTSHHRDWEIPNISLSKQRMRAYYQSGSYQKEIDAVAEQARDYLETNLPRLRQRQPAMVLDIDETTLSNYPHIEAKDFGYSSQEWNQWVLQAEAPALAGPLELFRYAREQGVAVFFITGRNELERSATERNLRQTGYEGWQELIMKPAGDRSPSGAYKVAHRRRLTEAGYTIVVNLGDQFSDLEGGYAEAVFKLPNPMYFIP